ncbi:signal transduction histidine kinase [Kineosphaera limosa]|uniref:histidine kinase n=1 Tax=Kineosphaera limosa NBRC 100340 TaxID=1184609 RepID=K6X7R5_9MICO|nr:histidine kinase [Kineosphaera limosa]NYD98852.1 signal transduction histidine kinase [Kineosphaera limosa]GAB94824.1 putative two-component histidine kinase [Kineosphaera limosa NBRC 100340]
MTTRRPPPGDLLLGAVGLAVTVLIAIAAFDHGLTWYTVAEVLIHVGLCATLLTRRLYRRASFVATYALLAALAVVVAAAPINLGVSPIILAAPLALYVVARHEPAAWGVVALLLGIAGTFFSPVNRMAGGPGLLVPVMILGMVGTYLWASGRRRTELAYADRLDRERAEHERELARGIARAQLDERVRIAREVHDVVAHRLAVVSVQSNTALAIGTPEQMRTALTGVKEASRSALSELRALLGVLRDGQPGRDVGGDLARLDDLVAATRDAGIDLVADLPDPATLAAWQNSWPAGIRLALVRVVQESLSNVVKHAGSQATARLRITLDEGECVVSVVNDLNSSLHSSLNSSVGNGPPGVGGGVATGAGLGLVGLAERMALVGGRFSAGPISEGFAVQAWLPMTTEPVTTEPIATEPIATEPIATEPIATEGEAAQ